MRKLKLELDALAVETFDPAAETRSSGGSIRAHQASAQPAYTCNESYDVRTCPYTCDDVTCLKTCAGPTCDPSCRYTECVAEQTCGGASELTRGCTLQTFE